MSKHVIGEFKLMQNEYSELRNKGSNMIDEVVAELAGKSIYSFVKTGIAVVDENIGGLKRGRVSYIYSEKNTGSVGLVYTIVNNILKRDGNVLFIAKKHPMEQHIQHLVCMNANVSVHCDNHIYSEKERHRLFEQSDIFKNYDLTMYPAYDMSISQIKNICVDTKNKHTLIVIDDAQCLFSSGKSDIEVMKELYSLAILCNCPIVVLDYYNDFKGSMSVNHSMTADVMYRVQKKIDCLGTTWLIKHAACFNSERTRQVELLSSYFKKGSSNYIQLHENYDTMKIW